MEFKRKVYSSPHNSVVKKIDSVKRVTRSERIIGVFYQKTVLSKNLVEFVLSDNLYENLINN